MGVLEGCLAVTSAVMTVVAAEATLGFGLSLRFGHPPAHSEHRHPPPPERPKSCSYGKTESEDADEGGEGAVSSASSGSMYS